MNRRKFLAALFFFPLSFLSLRWLYLFNLKKQRLNNLYFFENENISKNNSTYIYKIGSIKLFFNKNAVKNVKKHLPPIDHKKIIKKYNNFDQFLDHTYIDLEKNNNLHSGFYLSKSEIYILHKL